MSEKAYKQQLERIARDHGVDLIGFAPVDAVELASPPRPASDLLPDARTAVVLGAGLLRGALTCARGTRGAVKDAQLAYLRVEQAGSAMGRYLEQRGHACYLPPASLPVDLVFRRRRSYYVAEWSHRQAAVAAGLGVVGLNNLLVTPEFGPRVRLGGLLTTARLDLPPRPLPDNLCTGCQACVRACPVTALSSAGHPRLDTQRCRSNYLRPFLQATAWQTLKAMVLERGNATRLIQVLLEGYYFSCAECMSVCPRGRLT